MQVRVTTRSSRCACYKSLDPQSLGSIDIYTSLYTSYAFLGHSLQLYANFKIATVSCLPADVGLTRPGLFDFAGRAKYDAWIRIGNTLKSQHSCSTSLVSATEVIQAEARARYVEIAKEKLGFDETDQGTAAPPDSEPSPQKRDEDKTADELLDQADEAGDAGGTGMVSVSTMQFQEEEGLHQSAIVNGDTLHDLASQGRLDAIKAISPSAEQCNTTDSYGFTPLHLATDRGHLEVVRLLLACGADAEIEDSEGATALDTAHILENHEMIRLLEKARD